ncbi:TonB-dependent receptor [Gammaproteobacteria bacterium]|mgnify:CR=1 FL=1|nr:TonB-dependent receptor [Gammaproteobacteria bacterium]
MNKSKLLGLVLSIFVLTIGSSAFAEDGTSGTLNGKVLSSSGASISGAAVSVSSTSTGVSRSGVTSSDGSISMPLLAIGTYNVSISAGGYTTLDDSVRIRLGNTSYNFVLSSGDMEEMVVTAGARQIKDFDSTTTGISVDVDELINTTPVARNITAIQLLAPGTQSGDSAFGNLASIGGSSPAENVYIVNGLNTTNFRNFTGSSSVPFEFYEQVEVKTGGYQAEFGKATGGVVNAVTKSGSNDWEFGFNVSYTPDSLIEDKPDTYTNRNNLDERDFMETNVWVSGPIIKDMLFFYLLVNPEDDEYLDTVQTQQYVYKKDETFFGGKLDFYAGDKIHLEYTYFNDDAQNVEDTYSYDASTGATSLVGPSFYNIGGENHIGKASFLITDNLTAAITYGSNEYNRTTSGAGDSIPACYLHPSSPNNPGSGWLPCGDATNFSISVGDDEREIIRYDVDYYLGKHHIRLGFEEEELTANDSTINSGGVYYMYFNSPSYASFTGNSVAGQPYARVRTYESGGTFETNQEVLYLQDSWQVNDQLMVNAGIRRSSYDNKNSNGETFVKTEDQDAMRLGVTYDIDGDGNRKIFASYGEYYLPIAANTNIRMAGGETYIHDFYEVTADQHGSVSPVLGAQVNSTVYGDGSVPDTRSTTDNSLEPMYQEEIILGYAQTLESGMLEGFDLGITFTTRDLASTIEDVAIDAAVLAYCDANGITVTDTGNSCADEWTGFHQYVLTNPGSDMNVYLPELGTTVDLSAADLNYPEVSREYKAIAIALDRPFDGDWGLKASYTWSSTKGNYEGTVKSDNGQDDAGITQDFDQPGLTDGSYGYLPNHRRHLLKVFGTKAINDKLTFGMAFRAESPRKFGCIGTHPTDVFASAYGDSSWYCEGKLTPRASAFESDTITTLDALLSYRFSERLIFRLDMFNVLDSQAVTDMNEYGESGGAPNPNYQLPVNFQAPRKVRLGMQFDF